MHSQLDWHYNTFKLIFYNRCNKVGSETIGLSWEKQTNSLGFASKLRQSYRNTPFKVNKISVLQYYVLATNIPFLILCQQ